jgi:hypothetical protein
MIYRQTEASLLKTDLQVDDISLKYTWFTLFTPKVIFAFIKI